MTRNIASHLLFVVLPPLFRHLTAGEVRRQEVQRRIRLRIVL